MVQSTLNFVPVNAECPFTLTLIPEEEEVCAMSPLCCQPDHWSYELAAVSFRTVESNLDYLTAPEQFHLLHFLDGPRRPVDSLDAEDSFRLKIMKTKFGYIRRSQARFKPYFDVFELFRTLW